MFNALLQGEITINVLELENCEISTAELEKLGKF
jgi:hypothetical protein